MKYQTERVIKLKDHWTSLLLFKPKFLGLQPLARRPERQLIMHQHRIADGWLK